MRHLGDDTCLHRHGGLQPLEIICENYSDYLCDYSLQFLNLFTFRIPIIIDSEVEEWIDGSEWAIYNCVWIASSHNIKIKLKRQHNHQDFWQPSLTIIRVDPRCRWRRRLISSRDPNKQSLAQQLLLKIIIDLQIRIKDEFNSRWWRLGNQTSRYCYRFPF